MPHELPPIPHNRAYLTTKIEKMGHELTLEWYHHGDEQGDAV
jgi:hypothetical protein